MTAACSVQRAGRPKAAGVVRSRQCPLVWMRSGSESVLRLLEWSELLEGVQGSLLSASCFVDFSCLFVLVSVQLMPRPGWDSTLITR